MLGKIVKTQEIANSSQVKNVAITDQNELVVTFTKGTDYLYKGVTPELFEQMLKSESVGKFLNSNIKGKFEYIQILPKGSQNET